MNTRVSSFCLSGVLLAVSTGLWAQDDGLTRAESAYTTEDYQTAIIELKNVLQENPKQAEARLLLGRSYLKAGDVVSAAKELERAQALGIDATRIRLELARAKMAMGDFDAAIDQADPAEFSAADKQSEAWALRGYAYLGKQQLADAKESFATARALDENGFAIIGQARLTMLERKFGESRVLIDEALALDSNDLEALFSNAQLHLAQKDYAGAEMAFSRVLDIKDKQVKALLGRAESRMRQRKNELAFADLNQVLEKHEQNPQALFIKAQLHLQAGEYDLAREHAEKVLRVFPEHTESMALLGASQYALNNFEQAKFYLEKAMARRSDNLQLLRLLGSVYLRLADPQSAVALLEPINKNYDHKDAHLLLILGRAYLETGEYEKSTDVLREAAELDPSVKGLRTQLALGQIATGDNQAAIQQLQLADTEQDSAANSVLLVLSHLKNKDFGGAEATIARAINSYPENPVFHNLQGVVDQAQGRKDQSRSAFERALGLKVDYVPALLALASLDVVEDDIKSAKRRYKQILNADPKHLRTLLSMAQLSEREGNQAEAIDWVELARKRSPNSAVPVTLLVRHYLKHNETDKAMQEAATFQSANPKNPQALSLLAKVLMLKGELKQASYHLQSIIELNPKDINHRLQLAQIELSEKAYDEALMQVDQVLAMDESHLGGLAAKAQVLASAKRFDEAAKIAGLIEESHPNSHLGPRLTGDVLSAQGKTEESLQHYERAFARSKTPYLAQTLHSGLVRQGNHQQAVTVALEYLKVAPGDDGMRLRLASSYQSMERNDQAIIVYEELLQRRPGNVVVLNNLAWTYWLEGDQRSLTRAKEAYKLAPEKAQIADTYGWVMLHQGDAGKALEILQKAASRLPNNPEVRFHLATALNKNGQREEARKEVRRLLRDHGGFEGRDDAEALLAELITANTEAP